MIKDIPSERDFVETGLSLLGFAWDSAIELLSEVQNPEDYGDDPELIEAFWSAARQTLLIATTIAQQGVEFIIKGRIVAVSPFLLIANAPRDWPRGGEADVPFAAFRAIDAQDLVRVHDTVATRPFDPEFVGKFEELRANRNAIVHTIDHRIAVQAADVLRDILVVYRHLFHRGDWLSKRREYLERSPAAELYSADFVEERVVWEVSLIAKVLTNGEMSEFFGFSRQQRKYICPVCACSSGNLEMLPDTAMLDPNTPSSTAVHCFVCGVTTPVTRTDCKFEDCPGNVMSSEESQCLTCGRHGAA